MIVGASVQRDGHGLQCRAGLRNAGWMRVTLTESVERVNIVAPDGRVIGWVEGTIKKDLRPVEVIPDGYDPKSQRRGCCDPPDPSMKR